MNVLFIGSDCDGGFAVNDYPPSLDFTTNQFLARHLEQS